MTSKVYEVVATRSGDWWTRLSLDFRAFSG